MCGLFHKIAWDPIFTIFVEYFLTLHLAQFIRFRDSPLTSGRAIGERIYHSIDHRAQRSYTVNTRTRCAYTYFWILCVPDLYHKTSSRTLGYRLRFLTIRNRNRIEKKTNETPSSFIGGKNIYSCKFYIPYLYSIYSNLNLGWLIHITLYWNFPHYVILHTRKEITD